MKRGLRIFASLRAVQRTSRSSVRTVASAFVPMVSGYSVAKLRSPMLQAVPFAANMGTAVQDKVSTVKTIEVGCCRH